MEQKERYEWNSRFDEAIKDNQTGDIVNAVEVLNQQSKRIKELEDLVIVIEKNQQLKQQLHELPKKIVEDIKMQMGSIEDILINCGNGKEDALCWLNRILETTLKKYGGEDERK